ncbi:MAG: aldehyde dehydrogenase family protein, partial [Acidobacteriota bacterium]|nr:aldehyde dehydrogenase family protein [Acidobacteriota bacterium]
FSYSGQVCISVQRVLVQETVESELVGLLASRARALRNGDPLDDETEISVMISTEAAKNAVEIVAEAVAHGAGVICGGNADGSFLDPTLVGNVDPEMRIVTDEIFAPVATVESYEGFAEAIELANRSRFGLQAGVFTNDLGRAVFAADKLEYGGVMINDVPTFRVDNMPYGGMKDSGIGREGVRHAMEEMCEIKLIVTRYTAR